VKKLRLITSLVKEEQVRVLLECVEERKEEERIDLWVRDGRMGGIAICGVLLRSWRSAVH
jgi:hypothetical protein